MDNRVHFRSYWDNRLSRAIRHMVNMRRSWNDWLHMWHWEPRCRHSGRMLLLRGHRLLPGWCLMWLVLMRWVLQRKWIRTGNLT